MFQSPPLVISMLVLFKLPYPIWLRFWSPIRLRENPGFFRNSMSNYSGDPVKRKGRRSLLPITWFRQKNHLNKRSTQAQSPFFSKLPPELRIQIYRWAYSHVVPIIHITRSRSEDKLVHFPYIATNPQDPSSWQADLGRDIEGWGVQHEICRNALHARLRHASHDSPEGKLERTISPFLAILLTCHLMFVLV